MSQKNIEERLAIIEARNKRVELDKAWETSLTRRIVLILLTYLVIALVMSFADIDRPLVNAIIPAIGFGLSTLTISFVKKWWIDRQ